MSQLSYQFNPLCTIHDSYYSTYFIHKLITNNNRIVTGPNFRVETKVFLTTEGVPVGHRRGEGKYKEERGNFLCSPRPGLHQIWVSVNYKGC